MRLRVLETYPGELRAKLHDVHSTLDTIAGVAIDKALPAASHIHQTAEKRFESRAQREAVDKGRAIADAIFDRLFARMADIVNE